MNKPLSGVRVVELATFVAGPSCGRLLADLGAEVIKIEHPKGDSWRLSAKGYKSGVFTDDHNPVFDLYNSGKTHISLNLKSSEGMDAFHKLMETADVFVTNTRPAALGRLGISYEQLKERYPRLIYAILLGYGEKGPDAERPAFDTTAFWSRSGFLRDLTTLSDGEYYPVSPPFGVGDTFTGYLLMGQICAALYHRKETGKGDCVRSGLYHNAIFGMGTMNIITQDPNPQIFPRSRVERGGPGGTYRCSDGEWVYISVSTISATLQAMSNAIGQPDLPKDPRFSGWEAFKQNKTVLYEIFRDAFLEKPSSYWLQKATEFDIAMTRLNHFSEIHKDEQAWANGYLENVEFADGTVGVMPSSPIEMDSVGELKTRPAPGVGADTVAVLQQLGYTQEQIASMRDSGAVFVG